MDALPAALIEIVGMLNSPRYDDILLAEAGVALDRALFPLLVRIAALGPIGVAALAEHAGRDHSTVSRQVAKLEAQGLVARPAAADRRLRAVAITAEGERVAAALSAARRRLFDRILTDWNEADRQALATLAGRFARSMRQAAEAGLAQMAGGGDPGPDSGADA